MRARVGIELRFLVAEKWRTSKIDSICRAGIGTL
jgi:hypothetical protein